MTPPSPTADGAPARTSGHGTTWHKVAEEAKELAALFLYLAIFLGGFAAYRRAVLAEQGIGYFRYGYSLVEALVLAKVILVGDMLRIGEGFRDRPMIVPILYKTLGVSALGLLFAIVEHLAAGLIKGKGLSVIAGELPGAGKDEILAKAVIMLVAFLPLFALRQTGELLGYPKLHGLFLRKPDASVPARAP